jgi:NAD-dependent SIR2 family protein deacetylase
MAIKDGYAARRVRSLHGRLSAVQSVRCGWSKKRGSNSCLRTQVDLGSKSYKDTTTTTKIRICHFISFQLRTHATYYSHKKHSNTLSHLRNDELKVSVAPPKPKASSLSHARRIHRPCRR